MKLSSLRVDSARMEAGDWVADIPGMGDLRLRVRAMSNRDAVKMRGDLVAALPIEKKIGGRMSPETADGVDNQVIASTVLLGWENLTDDVGQALPFSTDAALALLSDPDMLLFKDAVRYAASTLAEVKAAALGQDVGNSAKPSDGTSDGVTGPASSKTSSHLNSSPRRSPRNPTSPTT